VNRVIFLEYLITFIEGLVSFISPCILPILPVYISYFAGESKKKTKAFFSALAFVIGFSVVFCAIGLFAGSLGAVLERFHTTIDVVCGIIIVILGLNFLDVVNIPFFKEFHPSMKVNGMFSAFIFGSIFSISHAPCVLSFLGAAIMSASSSGSVLKGFFLLLSYSVGMGVPFILSAVLTEKLSPFITSVKKNYTAIKLVFGILLIILGICMATGLFHELIHLTK